MAINWAKDIGAPSLDRTAEKLQWIADCLADDGQEGVAKNEVLSALNHVSKAIRALVDETAASRSTVREPL